MRQWRRQWRKRRRRRRNHWTLNIWTGGEKQRENIAYEVRECFKALVVPFWEFPGLNKKQRPGKQESFGKKIFTLDFPYGIIEILFAISRFMMQILMKQTAGLRRVFKETFESICADPIRFKILRFILNSDRKGKILFIFF